MATELFVATLATNNSLDDLGIFLKSLMLWNVTPPTIYLFADTAVAAAIATFKYTGPIHVKIALDRYTNKTRRTMEATKGTERPNMFFELVCEKLNLLDWVFSAQPSAKGVFFFDADICFFGPLPSIPESAAVMLSQHMIQPADEAKFGKYNAGFLWLSSAEAVKVWREACATSRFFEQAALECFDGPEWSGRLGHFGVEHNYGWWRLLQGVEEPAVLQRKWSLFRDPTNSGIRVGGVALGSVHTHWHEKRDLATTIFNRFVANFLEKITGSQPKSRRLHKLIVG